jgi:hypothetical protein
VDDEARWPKLDAAVSFDRPNADPDVPDVPLEEREEPRSALDRHPEP